MASKEDGQLLDDAAIHAETANDGEPAATPRERQLQNQIKRLDGLIKATRAEMRKLAKDIRERGKKHNKQMEHLRFLVQNRLNAKDTPIASDDGGTAPDLHRGADWKESIQPIGYLRSCFKRKNGTPRQPNLCPSSRATLKIDCFSNNAAAFEGLDHYSHVWLIFYFHLNDNVAVKPKIRPPKAEGMKVGVMATRAPHRPNPIGLSLCKLDRVVGDCIYLSSVDLVDGTPILDVKPYLPFFDNPGSQVRIAPWVVEAKQKRLEVTYTTRAQEQLDALVPELEFFESGDAYKQAVEHILAADPRSNYRRERCQDKAYAFTLDKTDVWVRFNDHARDGADNPRSAATIVDAQTTSQDDVLVEDASTTFVATAVVERIERYKAKKERTAGHLSEMVDDSLLLKEREWDDES
eukprot:TRINITY_DN8910_c0_g1_i3.p1 TRINITY_DN8910_c0_g1~~TRINITY_DN8910_c0_g1_i3.p1  ORF type:complete len:408 (+),score=93.90 TRINITY_DN8910_c0_g1_i3:183-1406(+)